MDDIKKLRPQKRDELATKLLEQREKKATAQAARREKQKAAGLMPLSIVVPAEQARHIRKVVALLTEHRWPSWERCEPLLSRDKSRYEWGLTLEFGRLPVLPPATSGESSVERP